MELSGIECVEPSGETHLIEGIAPRRSILGLKFILLQVALSSNIMAKVEFDSLAPSRPYILSRSGKAYLALTLGETIRKTTLQKQTNSLNEHSL